MAAGRRAGQREREGPTDAAVREDVARAFRDWAAHPDAWFVLLHGEILAVSP